jgi:hypothetical protein
MLVNISPSGNANKVLHDGAPPSFGFVTEDDISLSSVSTNNATTVRHGFLTALSGSATDFLNGNGLFTTGVPGGVAGYQAVSFSAQTSVNVPHNLDVYPLVQVIDVSAVDFVTYTVTYNSLNDFTVDFSESCSGTIIYTAGSAGTPQIAIKVADYPLTASDTTIIAEAQITLTLPSATAIAGKYYRIKRRFGGGPTIIQTTSGQTIDDEDPPLYLTSNYDAVLLQSDGTNWVSI